MTVERPAIEPLKCDFKVQFHREEELNMLQEATLEIMETIGVLFPSEKALSIFAEHGAEVDTEKQLVKIPRDLVFRALSTVPRYFHMGARDPSCDLHLEDGMTFFTTDGCGVETIDFETRERRPSRKDDVAKMAHVVDYLPSVSFYWPMVSAQDHGKTAPIHELDASWNNTVKHVQSETIMGEALARYAVEMGIVIAGDKEELRRRPMLSLLVCTIAPLIQDRDGIEGALVMAEHGIPVGFMSMPTLGTTAPVTKAGALAMADAEIISAVVLMQLAHPGAPVFHSLLQAWADPRSGKYLGYPVNNVGTSIPTELAHHWGMPTLAGAFGTDSPTPGTWQSAQEVALDPLIVGLAGAELSTGIGLNDTYTLLYPEAIILDNDLYQRARHALKKVEVTPETLAIDVIANVGPGGHFLGQKHTRKHMRTAMTPSMSQQMGADGKYRDPLEAARERVNWILKEYRPEPLEEAKRAELTRILTAADGELG